MDSAVLQYGEKLLVGNGLTRVVLGDIRQRQEVLENPDISGLTARWHLNDV